MQTIKESFLQAFDQLRANKLRSFLSLLGVMVGIFCIMAVKSAIDSLEDNVRGSVNKLGSDILYVAKFSWGEDPGENYWKYARRPNPAISDYKACKDNVKTADLVAFSTFIGTKTIKYERNSVDRAFAVAITEEYDKLHNLEYADGRFFTSSEYNLGLKKIILGFKVANLLFGENNSAVGKEVEAMGQRMEVVGVLKESGKDLLKIFNYDNAILIGFETARFVTNVKPNSPFSGNVMVKAAAGISEKSFRDDVTIALRKAHALNPRQSDDFSINSMSILTDGLNKLFSALNVVGWVIGGFALLVGMFSVANIIFVSVKERTSIIGIKKALGAKQYEILLEFLIESVVLCLIGGFMGLGLVFLVTKIISLTSAFEIYVSINNALFTFALSVFVGVIAGILPALQASRMDPVAAIRA